MARPQRDGSNIVESNGGNIGVGDERTSKTHGRILSCPTNDSYHEQQPTSKSPVVSSRTDGGKDESHNLWGTKYREQ